MADPRKTDKPEAPDLGTVVGTGLLELARTGRLTDPTYDALSDAFDPKPDTSEADEKAAEEARQAEADRAELAELRAARDAGTTKGAKS